MIELEERENRKEEREKEEKEKKDNIRVGPETFWPDTGYPAKSLCWISGIRPDNRIFR